MSPGRRRKHISVVERIQNEIEARGPLRGTVKLRAALAAFGLPIAGRIALDVGASTGGFTMALLEAGARRVYAVDAGYGQLLGRLRQDARVVNLERTNLGVLGPSLVPDVVDVLTLDLSYLAIAAAAPQLSGIAFAPDADLMALVKPMFELGLAAPPADPAMIDLAVARAAAGLGDNGWRIVASIPSPVLGAGGAREAFLHARRSGDHKTGIGRVYPALASEAVDDPSFSEEIRKAAMAVFGGA